MATVDTMATPLCGSDPGLLPINLRGAADLLPTGNLGAVLAVLSGAFTSGCALENLPGELLLEIYKCLNLAGALALAATCKRLRQLYVDRKAHIVLEILPMDPEFSPADGLLQVVAMEPSDVDVPWGTRLDKEIWFKRRMLCAGRQLPIRIRDSERLGLEDSEAASPAKAVSLEEADIDHLLEICKVVRGWERLFPCFRFTQHPEHSRMLRENEARRLRGAIYHWMRYDYYFHSDSLPRPSPLEPAGFEMRCNYVRMLDSGETSELADLWITVKSAVMSLCPNIAAVRVGVGSVVSEEEAAGVAWGATEQEHFIIASTMLKLGPEKLLYYINHEHKYSKARLIDEIRRERPGIESDIESLTMAIRMVHRERHSHCLFRAIPTPPSPFGYPREPVGGVLDWGEDLERLRGCVKAGFGLVWSLGWEDGNDDEDDQAVVGDEEEERRGMIPGGLRF